LGINRVRVGCCADLPPSSFPKCHRLVSVPPLTISRSFEIIGTFGERLMVIRFMELTKVSLWKFYRNGNAKAVREL